MRLDFSIQISVFRLIKFNLLVLSVYCLLSTVYTAHAQQPCNLRVSCWDGSSKIQFCTGIWDGVNGRCDVSEGVGTCNECTDPVVPGPEGNNPLPVTAPATSPVVDLNSQSSTPNSNLPSKEEAAIYRVNQGTIPKEAIREAPEQGIIDRIRGLAESAWSIFFQPPNNKPKYFAESESLHQAKLPPETKKQEPNIIDTLKGYLGVGSSAGIYSATLPISGGDDKAYTQEKLYQQANFPEGIYPIVDPSPTPTPRATAI